MHRKWTKVKKELESFICESLRGRVGFFVTNYRKAHDQMGRAFITVDKKEIFNMCTISAEIKLYGKEKDIRELHHLEYDVYNHQENRQISEIVHELLINDGVFAQYDFFNAVNCYLLSPIEESLNSNNILIKILSLIDRRVGKRTLLNIKDTIQNDPCIVQFFYELRCRAENIN